MDNIQRLEQQADYIANNLTEWEAESIARIARRCGKIGKLSKAEAEKFDTEKEAKKEWEKIVSALAIATALNIRSLKKAYTAEFEDWHTANKYLYDYRGIDFVEIAKNKQMQGIIDDFVKQNGKDILNLTNTKALRVLDRNGTPIRFQDEIYKAFSEAVGYVKEGRTDFYSAMRQTVQNLGGGGCKIDYGGGITRRLDTVVRQNMLYGMKQAHKEYNALVGQELGCDGIEIDYHSNARPSHRFMQGKQYSKREAKTVNGVYYPSAEKEGVYARLYEDYNCYHYETDIILGVSEPRYSAEELRGFDEQDNRLYKVGDIEKDGYGWSQSMRAIEADIRKSKDEINALSALGGNEAKIKELKNRIKTFQGKYDEISDITGIAKDKRRLSVQKSQSVLTNGINGGIIKENIKKPITPITDNAISKVPKVSVDGFTDDQNIFIQNQHKDLLKYARDNNDNKEVAFVFRKDLRDRAIFVGGEDVIDFGNGLFGKGDNLFVMHNHPRNSSFSKTDLDEFINNNSIKTLSIVKNNGEVEVITKSEKYSKREAYLYKERYKRKFAPNKTDAEYNKMVQKFLSYCEKEDIIRWTK